MKVILKRMDNSTHFYGISESGHTNEIHSPILDGEEKKAQSPMEALLTAAAGCTSIDLVLILNKMKQNPADISIEIEGERMAINDAKPFRKIDLTYNFTGEIDHKKAERAVQLSVEKYCSVLESLHQEIKINWTCKFL